MKLQSRLEQVERQIQSCRREASVYKSKANDYEERLGYLKKEGESRTEIMDISEND